MKNIILHKSINSNTYKVCINNNIQILSVSDVKLLESIGYHFIVKSDYIWDYENE